MKSAYIACLNNGCPREPLDELIEGAPHSLDNPTARFPNDVLNDCLFLAEKLTGITGMGIHFGRNIRPSTLMDIGYALLSCNNLADMIGLNGRYQKLTQQIATGHLEPHGKKCHLIWTPVDSDAEYQRPATEGTMAGYTFFGRWVTWDPDLQIEELHMRHSEPADMSLYRSAFPFKLVFDSDENRLIAPGELFRRPLPQANPELVEILTARLDTALANLDKPLSVRAQTFACVQSTLQDGAPNITRTAAMMSLTERTLRRRLESENYTFREVLEDARRDACELYLSEGKRSITDLALLLGYSEQSAFTRAFKKWFGVPPSKYKKS